uniref:Putative F-box/LRR-repeat protein 3 n=2 Tax=Davidia involucrata TaxID=16924 RepID=A0A5B6YTX5_DAVIN
MDAILCDELLQEIFHRLPPPSSSAVSLVSKRWLRLYRSSKTSLSLRVSPLNSPIPSLSPFLSHYPLLSSLSLTTTTVSVGDTSTLSDHLLLSVSSSCPNLRNLRFLIGPVSFFSLLSLSTSCPRLTSLTITLSRPLSFHWLVSFLSLKALSVVFTGVSGELDSNELNTDQEHSDATVGSFDAELPLETLSLSGTRPGDYSLNWLWRNCKNLRRLQLRSCEGIGDNASFSSFVKCLKGLQEVELRTCRTIVGRVLLKLAENCISLNSLLVYDGGSNEALLQFITLSRCNLRKLDLRLPLDLNNNHLLAMAENFRGLSSLRLQSCCLITGEGLKTLGVAMSNGLEELGLMNCDVVEREPGFLTTLGQNLRRLRKLDLSYNEMLVDKEFISMLVSSNGLCELKLRGCKGLTNVALVSMSKNCKHLESVDILDCCGIEAEAVELFVLNSPQLRYIQVEKSKISSVARMWASNKFIEVN